jgi:transposase-like protein
VTSKRLHQINRLNGIVGALNNGEKVSVVARRFGMSHPWVSQVRDKIQNNRLTFKPVTPRR